MDLSEARINNKKILSFFKFLGGLSVIGETCISMQKALMTKQIGAVHHKKYTPCTTPICFVISAFGIEIHVSQFCISLRDSAGQR